MTNPPGETAGSWRWFKCFQYDKTQDKPGETRNVLLIVTALITAVTFQAGVNPPGGVWQDSDGGHTAGRAIYAAHQTPFYVFLISNTLALSSAILVIICLTYRQPRKTFHFFFNDYSITINSQHIFNISFFVSLFLTGSHFILRCGSLQSP